MPAAWVVETFTESTMVTTSVPLPVLDVAFQILCDVGEALYPTKPFADPYGVQSAAPDDPEPTRVALAKNWLNGAVPTPAVEACASVEPPLLVNGDACALTRYPLVAFVFVESTTVAVVAEGAPGMAISVMEVLPLALMTQPLGAVPQALVNVDDSGVGKIVTPGVVPVSIVAAPFMVVRFDVYVPPVGVLLSPSSWMETAVPAAMTAVVNV